MDKTSAGQPSRPAPAERSSGGVAGARRSRTSGSTYTKSSYAPDVPVILRAFLESNRLTVRVAAHRLGISESALKGYLRGNAFNEAAAAKILPYIGAATLEEAGLRYDRVNERVEIFDDFARQSEGVFLAHFEGADQVRETRLMLSAYAPPPPDRMQYRHELNRSIYERLLAKTIRIQKIEQINKLERAVDLVHNMRTFDHDNYEVRMIGVTDVIFPHLQLSIFDRRSVITGGFHADKGPPHDPFVSYVGERFADFHLCVWQKLGEYSNPLSTLPQKEMLDVVLDQLRTLRCNGKLRYPELTVRDFEHLVVERGRHVAEYATRY